KLHFINQIIVLLLLACGAGQVKGQYESFFKNFPITYDIASYVTCYTDDYDPGILGGGVATNSYIIEENDTITYNDTLYYRCHIQDYCLFYTDDFFVREDTSLGHIYRYYPELHQEVLWCDMSLEVGDTFHLPVIDGIPWYQYSYNEENTDLIVDSIIYMNGRKIIYFPFLPYFSRFYEEIGNYNRYNIYLRFIEGIGPSFAPFGFIKISHEDHLSVLLCVSQNDSLIYMTHPDLQCAQNDFIGIATNEKEVWNIYPNPANETLNIDFISPEDAQGKLMIFDIIGNVILIKELNDTHTQINISSLSAGVYTLFYVNNNGKTISKFIKSE
ncbi:MAG: T9SS type A sorting domain-containing protein, partial [Bacteroidales bacterium]|nr:T9SS type A sorting domain-containing protein [Bacteroidales bacterium]